MRWHRPEISRYQKKFYSHPESPVFRGKIVVIHIIHMFIHIFDRINMWIYFHLHVYITYSTYFLIFFDYSALPGKKSVK